MLTFEGLDWQMFGHLRPHRRVHLLATLFNSDHRLLRLLDSWTACRAFLETRSCG